MKLFLYLFEKIIIRKLVLKTCTTLELFFAENSEKTRINKEKKTFRERMILYAVHFLI